MVRALLRTCCSDFDQDYCQAAKAYTSVVKTMLCGTLLSYIFHILLLFFWSRFE